MASAARLALGLGRRRLRVATVRSRRAASAPAAAARRPAAGLRLAGSRRRSDRPPTSVAACRRARAPRRERRRRRSPRRRAPPRRSAADAAALGRRVPPLGFAARSRPAALAGARGARAPAERERPALDREQRLRGDPDRGLVAGARVAVVAVAGAQRARGSRGASPTAPPPPAAGDQPLDRPGGRLGVDDAARAERPAAAARWARRSQRAPRRPTLPPARRRRAPAGPRRSVGVAGRAGAEAPAAVAVLGPAQPARRTRRAARRRRPPARMREDVEGGQVDLAVDRAVAVARAAQLGDQVASGEAARVEPRRRRGRGSCARGRRSSAAGRLRAQVVDRGLAALRTSSGLRPAASSPSIAQPVIAGLDG